MAESHGMRELTRIRQAIREQRYRISSHANEEMSDDDLEAMDNELPRSKLRGIKAQNLKRQNNSNCRS